MGKRKKSRDSSSDSSSDSSTNKKTLKKKKKKRKHVSSSSSSSSDNSDSDNRTKRKYQRQERREKKKLKRLQKQLKKLDKQRKLSSESENAIVGPSVSSVTPEGKRSLVPMTKEEYDKQQSEIRREFDPTTGRTRLVRGSGEIVEEIVSKSRQKEINKQATIGDGIYYQKQTGLL